MKNNKTLLGIIIVIVILGLGSYMLKPMEKNNTVTTNKITKVGVVAPLTGPLAEYGQAFKNGIVLANEKNKNPNIEYIFEDGAYDSGKSIAAFRKLKDVDKIDVLMVWGGSPVDAIAPLMKDEKIPFLAGSTLSRVTESSPYTIRMYNTADDFGSTMWVYFRKHNLKKLAIVKDEHVYFNSLVDALNKTKNADEEVTVIDNYTSFDTKDFRTSIVKIKKSASQYDAVGVLLASGQIQQFYKQASELGLNTPTFGSDFFENQSDIDAAGKSINGVVYANYNVSDNFKEEYKTRFGNVSQISFAGNSYDVTTILNKADLTNKDTIISSLKATKGFEGALGAYNYKETSDDRYLISPVKMKIIMDGVIKLVD